ncbi:MAG: hypothetical protein WAM82_30920 [Thermoanaerobaculia bacterium]
MKKTKTLLLACAFLLTAAAATLPAKSDVCITYGLCRNCTTPIPEAKPCRVVTCGTHTTETCGDCTTNCVPPPD